MRSIVSVINIIVGVLAMVQSIRGNESRFKRPGAGGDRRAPGWFARPFFFILGAVFLWYGLMLWFRH